MYFKLVDATPDGWAIFFVIRGEYLKREGKGKEKGREEEEKKRERGKTHSQAMPDTDTLH